MGIGAVTAPAPEARAVFLDRDGVINPMWYDPEHGLVDSPANCDQFSLLPGVAEAIGLIRQMGFRAVVISNQPGIAKGKCTRSILDQVTSKMHRLLSDEGAHLDGVYYCLHHPEALHPEYQVRCDCRKPKPGLLLRAGGELGIDLPRSYFVGDGITDIQAGRQAGCRTVWIGRQKCEICQVMLREDAVPDLVASSLLDAARAIRLEEVEGGNLSGHLECCRD
jgi:D-glycero-D-manno-heptose 1,7-bisphosphate phosphatase